MPLEALDEVIGRIGERRTAKIESAAPVLPDTDSTLFDTVTVTPQPKDEKEDAGFLQAMKAAERQFGATRGAVDFVTDPFAQYQDFGAPEVIQPDPELMAELTPEQQEEVLGQYNSDMAWSMADEMRAGKADMRMIEAQGTVSKYALPMVASIVDPTSLIGGWGVLKAVKSVGAAYRMGKLGNVAVNAAGGAIIGGGETALGLYGRENRDEEDIVIGTLMGAGIGGIIGRFTHLDNIVQDVDVATKAVARKAADDIVQPELPKTESIFHHDVMGRDIAPDDISDEVLEAFQHGMQQKNVTKDDILIAFKAEQLKQSGNLPDKIDLKGIEKAVGMNFTQTDALRLLRSDAPVLRMLSSNLFENAAGTGRTVNQTAALIKTREVGVMMETFAPTYERSVKQFANEGGFGMTDRLRFKHVRAFDREVYEEAAYRYVHGTSKTTNKHVKATVDAMDTASKHGFNQMKRHGVAGTEKLTHKVGFIPLVMNATNITNLVNKGGRSQLEDLFGQAYKSVGLSDELAKKVANAQIQRAERSIHGVDVNPSNLLSRNKHDELKELLIESGIKGDDVDGIFKRLDEIIDRDASGTLQARVNIDLNAQVGDLKVIDFVETDVMNLMSRSYQEMAGRTALAQKGIKNFDDMQRILAVGKSQAAKLGEKDLDKLDSSAQAAFNSLLGRRVDRGVSAPVRRMLDYGVLTKLGGLGFAQAAEISQVMAAHGMVQTMMGCPAAYRAYRGLVQARKTGDFSKVKPLFEDMRVFAGDLMDEQGLFRPSVHLDETIESGGDFWRGYDKVAAAASDKMGVISGFRAVKGMEQALTRTLMTDKVIRIASGKRVGGLGKKALKDAGYSDDVVKLIQKELKHVEYNGKSVNRLNLDRWNPNTREEFLAALDRHTGQVVQRQQVGEGNYWMHKDLQAMMFQFKQFPLLAMEKQLGRHLNHGNMHTALVGAYSTATSSMIAMSKEYTYSIGKEPKHEKAVWERTTRYMTQYNSMLGLASDAVSTFTSGGRYGLGSTPPALKSFQEAAQVATGDVRKLPRLMWYGSLPGVANVTNFIANQVDK